MLSLYFLTVGFSTAALIPCWARPALRAEPPAGAPARRAFRPQPRYHRGRSGVARADAQGPAGGAPVRANESAAGRAHDSQPSPRCAEAKASDRPPCLSSAQLPAPSPGSGGCRWQAEAVRRWGDKARISSLPPTASPPARPPAAARQLPRACGPRRAAVSHECRFRAVLRCAGCVLRGLGDLRPQPPQHAAAAVPAPADAGTAADWDAAAPASPSLSHVSAARPSADTPRSFTPWTPGSSSAPARS